MSNHCSSKIIKLSSLDKSRDTRPICAVRPIFKIRPGRSRYHRPRHHNPGTRYRPDPRLQRHPDRRIQLISSIDLVPPPIPTNEPSTSNGDHSGPRHPTYRRPFIGEINAQWRNPKKFDLSPVRSEWKKARELIPAPVVDYRYGFDIFPGPAYQPVTWYENREAQFPPTKIDLPKDQRPRMHDSFGRDPRSLDLRVRLEQLRVRDLREKLDEKRAEARLEPTETPEQAVARLHEGAPPLTEPDRIPEPAHPPIRPAVTDPSRTPAWPTHLNHQPAWPGPLRRRRRCRLVIIKEPIAPTSRTSPGGTA